MGSIYDEIFQANVRSIGCSVIGKVLKHPKSKLKDLRLPYCQLDGDRLGILCDALLGNSTTKKLSLRSNKRITSVGWQALSTELQHPNCKLIELDLHSTGMNDYAADMLGSALRRSSVRALNLSWNRLISSAGWQTLLNNLSQTTSIVHLKLNSNNITDDGLALLANMSDNMKTLNIMTNRSITPTVWRLFFKSLQTRGTQLKKLNITNNKVGIVGATD